MDSNFTFYQKLLIIQTLDMLDARLIDVLKQLNKYRNRASHELQYNLTERDIDLIGSPFGEYYIKRKKKDKNNFIFNTRSSKFAFGELH